MTLHVSLIFLVQFYFQYNELLYEAITLNFVG
jgi:hypothetical protein